MAVPNDVMQHVVHVESSYNPYAIGVVGGRLVRQPRNLAEALATARMLEKRGYNFSIGLAQVNRYNLARYGLDSYERAFQSCPNLQAGSRILADCYERSGHDWGKSFSCYYSGNFTAGYRHGYVQKIFASMHGSGRTDQFAAPIDVVDARKAVKSLEGAGVRGQKLLGSREDAVSSRSVRMTRSYRATEGSARHAHAPTIRDNNPPARDAVTKADSISEAASIPGDQAFVF